mmetsp:Transcript_30578/g.56985  ORF Transcript_30578/g.56985 Transcript_30578/m.56985 type:complete len:80 (+) Transcript_30578:706-945(+)
MHEVDEVQGDGAAFRLELSVLVTAPATRARPPGQGDEAPQLLVTHHPQHCLPELRGGSRVERWAGGAFVDGGTSALGAP